MNAKTIVFADLHHPPQNVIDAVEDTIRINRPCNVIFLGDYFDQYGDCLLDAKRTANWLVESLKDPTRIHLIGNHDLSYFYPGPYTSCSGYTRAKNGAILNILEKHIPEFRSFTWVSDILLTHAGLSHKLLVDMNLKARAQASINRLLTEQEPEAIALLKTQRKHWFSNVSYYRGGMDSVGGIFWCDYYEFVPIKGIRQIFGHSKRGPKHTDPDHRNLLLDSRDGYYWAFINEVGEVTVNKLETIP